MICYALATCFNTHDPKCYIPGNYSFNLFFPQRKINEWQKEIDQFSQTLTLGVCDTIEKNNYFIYALKLREGYYYAVACDTRLSLNQTNWLWRNLMEQKIPMEEVAKNLEKYTCDQKIEIIKHEIAATTELMRLNVEKTIARGENTAALLEKTNALSATSFHFRESTEKLNSCFGSCTLL